ncbi:CBS domain-containing protein [Metabacillus crassostreae]|uniref:DUF294 nucleotidyltransferase-like domain-containing protein n=1 Tax=Metabacillus crassostreae TaxID=929098 RepID=UPI001958A485|nr:DUF294 nucleotidyltransferase-like domain-containing protein [Metabacillus crassostreae]MBM7603542.1 CBS domain-containing protein [Metabacillus crassostreae]
MQDDFDSYHSIKKYKETYIHQYELDTQKLNEFHDQMMKSASKLALFHLEKETGRPPCDYSWFVMGSGGRNEQGLISDQDHGIVYKEDSEHALNYFKKLGDELSKGLNEIGYPFCEGKVMSSNPLWCKSLTEWKKQLINWMDDKSWESIRYLQIFYDSRSILGDNPLITDLKCTIFDYLNNNKELLQRFMDNIQHIKNSVGPLGQIYVEPIGQYEGCIDLKKTAFLPYVNAIRLLAIKEGLNETSTLQRINKLCEINSCYNELSHYRDNFDKLLKYRSLLYSNAEAYDDVHYLNVKKLTKQEKREIKDILRDGKKLHQFVQRIIDKGCFR